MDKKQEDWEENNILFSEAMAFRARDRQMLIDVFPIWFDYTIKKYGKSKWIELKMQTRLEPKIYDKRNTKKN